MSHASLSILVLGASGFIGSNLVPRLLTAGHKVRVAGRQPDTLEERGWQNVDICRVDVLNTGTLAPALAGIDVVYYLIHGMTEGQGFDEREARGASNLAQAAQEAGTGRIIYLGALKPSDPDSLHIQSRTATGDVLREGKVPVTEIRAPVIIGPGSAAFEVMRDLVYNLPLMITPKWVRSQMAPIALDDLLFYLEGVLTELASVGQIYDAAGSEMLTYEEQMRRFAAVVGRRLKIFPVPLLTPELSARWLKFITAVPTGIASALIGGLKQDLRADDGPIRALLPRTLMGFDDSLRLALAQECEQMTARHPPLASQLKQRWQPRYSFYPKTAKANGTLEASVQQVWRAVQCIGQQPSPRYFALDILWRIREFLDRLVGGRGMDYRHPGGQTLAEGDQIDSWTVAEVVAEKRLVLLFGMKAPGMGGITFDLYPQDDGRCELKLTCWWHPAGAWGLAYWWAMLPAHQILFDRMVNNIGELAWQLPRAEIKGAEKTG